MRGRSRLGRGRGDSRRSHPRAAPRHRPSGDAGARCGSAASPGQCRGDRRATERPAESRSRRYGRRLSRRARAALGASGPARSPRHRRRSIAVGRAHRLGPARRHSGRPGACKCHARDIWDAAAMAQIDTTHPLGSADEAAMVQDLRSVASRSGHRPERRRLRRGTTGMERSRSTVTPRSSRAAATSPTS